MKNITPSYPFGVLNQISKPTIQDRVDPRTTTFLEAAKKAAEDQYESDTLAQRGAFTGVILRVEYLETESSLLPWQRLIMPFSPELVQVFWRVKARIPELHVAIPEPSMNSMGQDDTGPHNHIIDMHPTFIATGPLPYEPAPGDIALFDFEDRQNQEGPQLLSIINGQNVGSPGSVPSSGRGGPSTTSGARAFRNARRCGGTYTSRAPGDVITRGPAAPVVPVQPTPVPRTGSVSEYLQDNGISQRLADNIDEYRREAPREKWPNMVTTALVIMELERRTGFHLEVFSTYRTGNPDSAHFTYGAVDLRPRYETGTDDEGAEVSHEEFVFCARVFIDFWRNEGEVLDMGLGFYQDNWYFERMIHIDTLVKSHRRWVWGPDNGKHPITGQDTGGKPFHEWFEGFGSDAKRIARRNNSGRLKEICKDAFWALIEQGFPSQDDFRRVFSGYGHDGNVGDRVEIRPIPDVNNIYEGLPRRELNIAPLTAEETEETTEGAETTTATTEGATEGADTTTEEPSPDNIFTNFVSSITRAVQNLRIPPLNPADQIPTAAPVAVTNCVQTVGEMITMPSSPDAGPTTVYPNNCNGYEIDGVSYFAAGDVNSSDVIYYFGGQNNQACADKSSSLRNLLSIISPNYFIIALNIGSHANGDAYESDLVLNTFVDQFENASPTEFNTIFSEIEASIIEQITGTPVLVQAPRSNVNRSTLHFSRGYTAFKKLYDIQDGAMFPLDGSVISGIGFLDSMYNTSANRRIIRLAEGSGGNIKVMGVHENSMRPETAAARDEFDTDLSEAGGFALRVGTSHGEVPAEHINTVIANITRV